MHVCVGSSADQERISVVLERRKIVKVDLPRPAIDSSIPSYCEPIFVSCHEAFVVDLAEVCAWSHSSFFTAAFSIRFLQTLTVNSEPVAASAS